MSLFSTPSPPSEAGGTGPAGGKPDFPSPTKLERNGLTGAELGAQNKIRLLGFTTLHDTRRYAIPQCWAPHTQTQRHGVRR